MDRLRKETAIYPRVSEQQERLLQCSHEEHELIPKPSNLCWQTAIIFMAVLIAGVLGFLSGRYMPSLDNCPTMARTYAENGVGLSYNVTTVFNNNQSFSLAPSPSSDAAWSSLFPKGQGYIVDPRSEAKVAGISAFHQLHCLNLLRRIYYAEKLGIKLDSHGPQLSVTHWGHCIDYLRRAIMCHADDNMEPVDDKTLQITLRDVPRKCRDYDVLKAWTEENRPPDLP